MGRVLEPHRVDAIPVTDDPGSDLVQATAAEALSALTRRFEPLAAAGLLGGRSVPEAVLAFHGLCEGMAVVELRGVPFDVDHERLWRDAFQALLTGFTA